MQNNSCIKLIELSKTGNETSGYLSFFEIDKEISFEIKRIYYIFDLPTDIKRGMHAHKKLKQVMWCPHGSVEVIIDKGYTKESYILDAPNKVLIIEKGYWRDFYARANQSVLCVAASDIYSEDDYIRDYQEFKNYIERGYWDEN